MRSVKRQHWIALCLICMGGVALASTSDSLMTIEQNLEQRVLTLIHNYDADAIVTAVVTPEKQKNDLPLTPFVINDLTLHDTESHPLIKAIDIKILTRKAGIPESIRALIANATRTYGVDANIVVEKAPDELFAEKLAAEKLRNEPTMVMGYPAWNLAGIVGVVLALFYGLTTYLKRKREQDFKQMIEGNLKRLADAIEGGGGELRASAMPMAQLAQTTSMNMSGSAIAATKEDWSTLPEVSVAALLTDCYWGSYDSYAAYIWRRIPSAVKMSITAKYSFLTDYAKSIIGMGEENLGYEQEPYYLAPLPIHHLSNEVLVELVRKTPSLMGRLSSLRSRALALSLRERMEMVTKTTALSALPAFDALKASEPRKLKSRTKLEIHTVEEEQELLTLGDLAVDFMSEIPSLVWLSRLDDKVIESILKRFPARELASAWVGPEEVLARMAKLLPDKKKDLVTLYKAKMQPSRKSAAYLMLHTLAMEQYRSQAQGEMKIEFDNAA